MSQKSKRRRVIVSKILISHIYYKSPLDGSGNFGLLCLGFWTNVWIWPVQQQTLAGVLLSAAFSSCVGVHTSSEKQSWFLQAGLLTSCLLGHLGRALVDTWTTGRGLGQLDLSFVPAHVSVLSVGCAICVALLADLQACFHFCDSYCRV